ncbi:MAG TPA: Ig-like domain-containing protein, partial [Isosphaeraceae bacterium]
VTKAKPRIAAFEQVLGNTVLFPTSVMPAHTGATIPTETVTFFANGKNVGQATLLAGTASIAIQGRGILAQSVSVLYNGDANYSATTTVPQLLTA